MAQRDLFLSPSAPSNSRRIIGAKLPFKAKHVCANPSAVEDQWPVRNLALFDCEIDSKLRGCDLVKLKVSDVAP